MTNEPTPEPRSAAPLRLRTLGGVGLYGSERDELLLAPGKPLALLIYTALTPGRRISREFLLDLLWSDLDPERARRALRQALFHLRRLLGDDALPGNEELTLSVAVDVDRDRFLAAVERGDLEGALTCYGGEFLPAFGVPGGADFEHWADLERDRLRAAFLRTAELVVRRQLNHSRFREAQKLARRIRDEVPDSEAAWRLLIETVIASRDFVSAAVEAAALEQWAAREDFGLESSTKTLIARARQITPAASESAASAFVAELTGREREFAAITAAWDSTRAGGARHLHLSAAAGLGKTRLLRDAVARMRATGALVVELSGSAGDRDIPYAFAADFALALAALPGAAGIAPAAASSLIALNPALSSHLSGQPDNAVGEDALRRRIHAFADLVHAIAHEQPFVFAIDDVHWLDSASYQVLEGLWSRLKESRVLCITAARPERTPRDGSVTLVPLSPLTAVQVASFVSAIGALPENSSWTDSLIAGLHACTRGSPLLILETLRLALDENILALHDAEWLCLDEARLASLLRAGEALRQRVRALPPEHGWLLALLATVGTPAAIGPLADVVPSSPEAIGEMLQTLERQGLVTRTSSGWLPTHDEIAQAARDAVANRQAEANRIVGALLFRSADGDLHTMLRGMRHLVAAGEHTVLQQQFVGYARLAREQRDRRRFAELAADVLTGHTAVPTVTSLVRALPLHWRVGLWSVARQRIAAATVLVVAVGAAAGMYARDVRDANVQRVVYADSARGIVVIPARLRDWDGRNTTLVAERGQSTLAAAALSFREASPAISPDLKSVAWNQDSGDSTTLDIWLRTPGGTRRLTRRNRDDVVARWLPDGSALVGMTNRWSAPGQGGYDVAIFDTATDAARPVTRSVEHEGGGVPSPDGTRIALIRESADGPALLCVAAFDGLDAAECRVPGGYPPAQLLGWSGPVELILTLDRGDSRPLVRYDWLHDRVTTLLGPHLYAAQMSPDRHWVVAGVRLPGIEGMHDWIIPLDRPTQARRVERPADASARVRWWEGTPDNSEMIDRIEFTDTARSILPGVSTRLGIRALTRSRTEIPLYAPVRWSSSDTLVATVDATGAVHPRTVGAVTIKASLAGWRSASKRIEIVGKPAVAVFEERWDDTWRRRWITFGEPAPVVVPAPSGSRAMWTHGDATYVSFVLQRQAFSARHGLGVEIELSTPLSESIGQRVRTVLMSGMDTAAFRGADQRKNMPAHGRDDASCGATFPAGDGHYQYDRLAMVGGITATTNLGRAANSIRTGKWWTLRLQILPDGRCGVAVNNQVVWVSTQPIPLNAEFRLYLGDASPGTKHLHGRLEMWSGVRTDIDWSQQ